MLNTMGFLGEDDLFFSAVMVSGGYLSTSPPRSPSPYEVSKERGREIKKEGLTPLLDALCQTAVGMI